MSVLWLLCDQQVNAQTCQALMYPIRHPEIVFGVKLAKEKIKKNKENMKICLLRKSAPFPTATFQMVCDPRNTLAIVDGFLLYLAVTALLKYGCRGGCTP